MISTKHILLFVFIFSVLFSKGTNYYVNDASTTGDIYCKTSLGVGVPGSSSNTGTAADSPLNSLSSVLTTYSLSFASGDTIFVDNGTYSEIFLSSPQNGVVIKGAGIGSSVYTKFIKSGSDRYFMFIDDNNTVLSDLIIEGYDNSLASSGKGMAVNISSGVTGVVFNNVNVRSIQSSVGGVSWPIRIESNTQVTFNGGGSTCNSTNGTTPGGGMLITGTGSTVSINSYQFINNYRNDIGANLCITGGNATNVVTINNTRFENGTSSGNKGVGIYISSGSLKVYDSYFKNNTIQDGGGTLVGGTVCAEGTATVLISRSTFTANTGTGSGGVYGVAIGINGASVNAKIDSCYFSGNSGSSGTHANDIEVKSGTALARYCVFSSSGRNINQTGGSFTVSNSGNPSKGGTITLSNTTVSSYTASPTTPSYTGTCASAVVLPIELSYFEGICHQNEIVLSWQTLSEKNNGAFIIERSVDGNAFKDIASLKGNGNSNVQHDYRYTDTEHFNSTVYYRLKQQDIDGQENYTEIISINPCLSGEPVVKIFPNPSNGKLNLSILYADPSAIDIDVFNMLGQGCLHEQAFASESGQINLPIDLTLYDKGIYTLKISIKDKIYTQKIIKSE